MLSNAIGSLFDLKSKRFVVGVQKFWFENPVCELERMTFVKQIEHDRKISVSTNQCDYHGFVFSLSISNAL